MKAYKAPTDFRATRIQNDYVLSADGYQFGTLVWIEPGLYQLMTDVGMLREELFLDKRPYLVTADRFAIGLVGIKHAYLRQDRYCFEEVQADLDTEARVAAHFEEGPAALRGLGEDL